MGCWYNVDGEVRVKDNNETRGLVIDLEDNGDLDMNISTEHHEDGTFTLKMHGGTYCSYFAVTDIDDTLERFGPHVVGEAACFNTTCDDECGKVWVGSPESVEKAQAAAAYDVAKEAVQQLTKEQFERLIEETKNHWNQ